MKFTIVGLMAAAQAINVRNYPGVTFMPQSDPQDGCGSGGCEQFKLKYDTLNQVNSDPICSSAGCTQYEHPYGNMGGNEYGIRSQKLSDPVCASSGFCGDMNNHKGFNTRPDAF